MSVDVGSVKRSVWLVKNDQGQLVNPSTATATVTVGVDDPVTVAVTLPPAVTGTLIADHLTAKTGLHCIDWHTQGPVTSGRDFFNVRSYAAVFGLDEARDYLGYPDGVRDATIRLLAGAATKLAESVVGTCVIRSFTGDWIPGYEKHILQLPHRPLPTAGAVTKVASIYAASGGPGWGAADLIANPDAGTVYLASQLDFWYGPWMADYQAGRIEVAENIVNGTKDILADLFVSQRAMFADTAEGPTPEEAATIESVIPAGYELPRRALEQLEPDRMPAFG